MTNFDTAREALDTSLNSAGSAMREHEKWQQSLEAQINKLKASWQSLSQAFLKSDFLKGVLNGVIGLVDGLTKLIDTFGALPTILGTVAAGMSLFKNKGLFTFDKDAKSIQLFGTQLVGLKDKYTQIQTAISRYNSLSSKSAAFQASYNKTLQSSSSSLGNYLRGLNGAKGSVGGYVASLIGAKAATIGLQIATTALNAAITMGISMLVSWGIEGIMKLVNAKKELAESVEEITSKFREQHNELIKNKSSFESEAERYTQLSKGVNALGENVSLTADEYSEYQSVVNSIADQIPSLISGYDSQGNAILNVKGNVEELVAAYEKLIKAQNNEVLATSGDVKKDFENKVEEFETGGTVRNKNELLVGEIELLEGILKNGYTTQEEIEEYFRDYDNGAGNSKTHYQAIQKALKSAGVDTGNIFSVDKVQKTLAKTAKNEPEKIKQIIENYQAQFEEAIAGMQSIAQATLSQAFDISDSEYAGMSDEMQNVAKQIVNSFDYTFYSELLDNKKYQGDVEKYINDMLNVFSELSNSENKQIETAFNLGTKFNNDEISYGEYVKGLEDAGRLIDGLDLDENIKTQIKLSLGLNEDGLVEEYNSLLNRLTETSKKKIASGNIIGFNKDAAKKFLDGLSSEELSVAMDVITDPNFVIDENATDKEIQEKIQTAIDREMAVQGLTFELNLEVESAGIEALNTALAETVSATGLSSESISALKSRYGDLEAEGYDLSAMFEETSNGVHLNRKALKELEQAYGQQKLDEVTKDLNELEIEYQNVTKDIENCRDAGERAALYVQRDAILKQINDAATLAAQYKGLTSAYNEWLAAEEAGQERDMYENMLEGFENIDDELARGWLDDGTIEFLELLTGRTDLATLSAEKLKEVYDGLDKNVKHTSYSIRDFFTVDEDGNSTSDGVYNFLDAIGQLEEEEFGGKDVIKRDKDGNIIEFDFKLAGGEQAVADALGISEELVQIMLRAADDAGFVVNLEGAYTQLADLKTEAEEARQSLINLQKAGKLKGVKLDDVNFDFNAEGNDLIKEQEKAVKLLDKFRNEDGTINLKMEGAQNALDIAEYLTIRLDDLTEPKYMEIDVSTVEEDLQEPIEQMQEFERLSKEKHLLTLSGDKEGLKEVNAEMDEIAQNLVDIEDKEVKAKLGIKGLSKEEIKEKLEKGEIEIDAGISIDLEMSDDLKDMRLMMMNQLGLVKDEEVKLKVGFDIDESVVDDLTPDQQKVVLEYIVANEKEFNEYTETEKETVVKLIADGVDLDKYKPKDKEAIVNYIANGKEADGWTPEAKEAFVKYLVDGGEPDKFDPENKDSWVVYDTDTTEPDSYDPKDPDATVTYKKDSTDVDGYNPPNYERKVTFWAQIKKIGSDLWGWITGGGGGSVRKVADGTANSDGAAFASGTIKFGRAFKQGDWRTKKTETALTGEFGRELVVTGNRWYTVGDNGAEFATIPKGSIVFNHRQTEELFKNGKVTSNGGRGRLLANGTAFAYGSSGSGGGIGRPTTVVVETDSATVESKSTKSDTSYGSSGSGGGIKSTKTSYNAGSSSTNSKSSKDEKEFKETFDWVETKISRLERVIDQLDTKASSVYRSWSERNNALASEIGKVRDEIDLQNDAYDVYMAKAKSVGLSETYAAKVRDGSLSIQDLEGKGEAKSEELEKLADKIKEYETWYEKALDCQDAILELKETESKLYAQRFENIQTQYDGILQGYEHTEAMLNEYISQAEEQGYIVSKKYYDALIENEKSNISELKKEQSDLIAERDKAVADGKIVKYSEEWYNMCQEIDSVTQAIEEGTTALIEYDNAIRDIDWQVFDLIQERISDITAESEFLIELMSNKDLFDDNGRFTERGVATVGLHALNYNTSMYQADEYGKEIANLDKQIAKDPYDQELINRRRELIELQRESILAAEDEKNAIRDLVEEGINLELDALQERIDLHNEELDSMKDLYDYQKNVEEQTKNIASLRKQLGAYEGFNDEETRAKVQELKVSLEEAEADLFETEYDRFISDQTALLDTLYTDYETVLNTRLDNIDLLLEQVIEGINVAAGAEGTITSALGANGAIAAALGSNATTIGETLKNEVGAVGTKLSTAMSSIWAADGTGKAVIDLYGKDFQSKHTTTNETLNKIKADVAAMVDDVDKDAQKKVAANKTTTSAQKNPTTNTSTTNKPTTNTNKPASSGDGKAKVGDKVKFISGKYYYDSQGKNPAGAKYQGKQVYITKINTAKWATHPYHISTGSKLGSGDLGWLKLNQLSGYATGKKQISNSQYAWTQENGQEYIVRPSDGAILTPVAKGDSVLNATASGNIWQMANNPAEFIKNNLGLDNTHIPNGANVNNKVTQNFENVVFSMPNVHNYHELLSEMQKDKHFEKLVLSMTVDQIAGKSKLAKNKAIR